MKANPCRKRRLFLIANKLVSVITLIFFSAGTVFALPAGQQVVNGQAAFNTKGNNLTITSSPNAIINWQGFSINNNEAVRFIQQYGSSAVLNRVTGQDPSRILGLMQSNGRVFLINPNGILFGQGARIDVNGLTASTLNISNQDFLAGKYNFTAGSIAGSIQNQGTITTPEGGKVYLIAPDIENSGIITSPKGDVLLAAGHSVQLVDSLDPDISVVVSAPENKAVNLGQIVAQSGKVGIYGGLISQRGIVNADSAVVGENGRIFFKASKDVTLDAGSTTSARGGTIKVLGDMESGTVRVSGTLDASAPNGGDGGFIETSAARVNVDDSARITTLAPYGRAGFWLIDPTDYTIAATDPLNGSSYMSNTTLSTNLAGGPIVIQTLASGSGNGDIFVNDAVSWSSANSLTLNAYRNININASITNNLYAPLSGKLILRADWDANGIGTVAFGGSGSVNMDPIYGTVAIYYNPTDYLSATRTADVATFNSKVTAATKTYYMLVNDVGPEAPISTDKGLQAMNNNLAGVYALGKDIDASATSAWNSGAGFEPVGGGTYPPFIGTFDGDGHTITGLKINRPTNNVGLFGSTNSATIKNVGIVNGNITGLFNVGGLVGSYNFGTISNSYSGGTVSGTTDVGGLVGYGYGGISNSYSTSAVSGTTSVGGLVGSYNFGTISNSYSTGAVSGTTNVGGLVGLNSGAITNSYWDTVTSGQTTSAGGSPLTTVQMMQSANFTGFDFTSGTPVWWMSDGNTRPFLRSEYSTNITNAHQLQLMGMNATTLAASYTLAGNIDMSELTQPSGLWNTTTGFVPVGTYTGSPFPFNGTFDGLGHTITGLSINRPAADYIGLFGLTYSSSTVQNVGLVNVNITGQSEVGGLVGSIWSGNISNSYSTGTVKGTGYVGGLVGSNNGTISSSYSTSEVIVVSAGSTSSGGGLVGFNDGTISNSYSTGAVTVTGTNSSGGGLVGDNYTSGSISNSYSTGAVTVTGTDSFGGGLVGYNGNSVSGSYWDTVTSGQLNSGGPLGGGTGKTTAEMKSIGTFAGWDIANTSGSSAVWRIYSGHTAPLLKSFLTPLTITADDVTKVYDGTSVGLTNVSYSDPAAPGSGNLFGVATPYGSVTKNNVGTYAPDLWSNQKGYDITVGTGTGTYGTLTVTPAALTIIATGVNKVYDGLTGATVTLADNRVAGDVLTTAYTSAAYLDKNVAAEKTVNVSGITLTSTDAGNYAFNTTAATTADITQASLTLSPGNVTKTYDGGLTAAGTATVAGGTLFSGDTLSGGTFAFTDKNVGINNKTVTVTSDVTVNDGNSGGNYNVVYADNTTSTINPYAVSLTGSRIYDGTANVAAGIFTLGTLVTTPDFYETLTLTGTGTMSDKNVGAGKTVNVSGLTLGNGYSGGIGPPPIFVAGLASNYTFTGGTQTATITQAPLTITAATNTKPYDSNATAAALPTITSGSLVGGDTATLTEVYDSKIFGTGKTLTPSAVISDGNGGNNYQVTLVNNTTGVIDPGQTVSGRLDVAAEGKTINFVVNGTLLADQASTDASGNYSGMFPLNSISNNSALLAYIADDSSLKSASVYLATGGDIANLLLSSNTVTATSGGAMSTTTLGDAKGALSSSDIPYSVSGNNLTLSSGFNFIMNAGGDITLNGLVDAGTGIVTLKSGGAIRNGMGSARSISAGSFFAEAVNGIGSGDPLMTGVNNISALNTAANHIQIDNTGVLAVSGLSNGGTGNVILKNIGAITTDTSTVTSSGGSVSITAYSPLTIGSGGVSAYGSISLEASPSGGSDNLTISGNIASSNGNIILSAGGGIVLGPGSSLSAPNGTITMTDNLNAPAGNLAVTGNATATDNTVSSLMTAMANITSVEERDDEHELTTETREGGERTTNDNRTEAGVRNYCN